MCYTVLGTTNGACTRQLNVVSGGGVIVIRLRCFFFLFVCFLHTLQWFIRLDWYYTLEPRLSVQSFVSWLWSFFFVKADLEA